MMKIGRRVFEYGSQPILNDPGCLCIGLGFSEVEDGLQRYPILEAIVLTKFADIRLLVSQNDWNRGLRVTSKKYFAFVYSHPGEIVNN
jgi:hypothetical protein